MTRRRAYLVMPFCIVLSGCVGLCKDTWRSEVTSPDGTYAASVFVRDCGATTPQYTHVVLKPRSFLSSYRDDNIAFSVKNDPAVGLRWTDQTHLMIGYEDNSKTDVTFRVESWRGIRITMSSSSQ